jgi:choloylglycine hydrolase
MKKPDSLIILLTLIFSFSFSANKNFFYPYKGSCSTFLLKNGSDLIAGHNLDDSYQVSGAVIINKRNVFKKGITWRELSTSEKETLPKPEWVSKWGSVSFNTRGRDFADGGMNEKGLIIWEMSLPGTKFIQDESKPKLFMMQWMQYQLDNHESVEQVIKSASDIVLDGWQWHFFTADRDGNCASIEFVNGKMVIHTGDEMPVKVLCNALYSFELKTLRRYEGFGGKRPVTMEKRKQPRFVHGAKMIKDYDPSVSGNIINYGFDILDQLNSSGNNQWQIIMDMKNLHVYIRTNQSREVRHFNLKSFDLSCDSPVKMIDVHTDLSGNITNDFLDYTFELNKKFVKMDIEGIIKNSPPFEQQLISNGISKDILIDRLARYSENTVCKK